MSNPNSPLANGDQTTTPIKIPSDSEDLVNIIDDDPLLGSGSFIDPNPANGTPHHMETPSAENNNNHKNTVTDDSSVSAKRTRPDWLPENWNMILRKRSSGATLGTIDRYYIAPTGQRLRSKNEVMTFLETGSKRKKPSVASPDDATPEGSAPRSSKKKTVAKKKVHAAFTFDFRTPPEKVSWCLTYASDDVWAPRIGDWEVPLSTKHEWAAVFNHVCQS
uniref:methyl-CpG-binding domain-containing protein 5-like n=1 Tax=Erigeron canadensis TaxID=72917 RepID=UPI001CB8FC56|nr:methyl-CpG-binding domain-containing protein 5-like [Erigeron canadensis]